VTLLLAYLALAVGVSFVCSLCEAALLSLGPADAEAMRRRGSKAGETLQKLKAQIDRPLAAILTLNTISHTIGAAGVGAQAIVVFGEAWIGATSAVLTLLILVLSEIIPKTMGASYARPLAAPTVYLVVGMIWLTWPVVVALNAISGLLQPSERDPAHSREHVAIIAELARESGALRDNESGFVTNALRLEQLRIADILTPRTVTFTLPAASTVADVLAEHPRLGFSRIPIHGTNPDDLTGVVLKHEIYEAALEGKGDTPLSDLKRELRFVPDTADALRIADEFGRVGHHLFGVVNEHGTFVGVVALEDVIESLLGTEIVDETDVVADLRDLASKRPFPLDAEAQPDA